MANSKDSFTGKVDSYLPQPVNTPAITPVKPKKNWTNPINTVVQPVVDTVAKVLTPSTYENQSNQALYNIAPALREAEKTAFEPASGRLVKASDIMMKDREESGPILGLAKTYTNPAFYGNLLRGAGNLALGVPGAGFLAAGNYITGNLQGNTKPIYYDTNIGNENYLSTMSYDPNRKAPTITATGQRQTPEQAAAITAASTAATAAKAKADASAAALAQSEALKNASQLSPDQIAAYNMQKAAAKADYKALLAQSMGGIATQNLQTANDIQTSLQNTQGTIQDMAGFQADIGMGLGNASVANQGSSEQSIRNLGLADITKTVQNKQNLVNQYLGNISQGKSNLRNTGATIALDEANARQRAAELALQYIMQSEGK